MMYVSSDKKGAMDVYEAMMPVVYEMILCMEGDDETRDSTLTRIFLKRACGDGRSLNESSKAV